MKEAKLYLPGKTLEEIEQHEDWHQKLIYLQDRKREVENLDTLLIERNHTHQAASITVTSVVVV